MTDRPDRPIWPYIVLLCGLFLLAATAPRSWQQVARREDPAAGGFAVSNRQATSHFRLPAEGTVSKVEQPLDALATLSRRQQFDTQLLSPQLPGDLVADDLMSDVDAATPDDAPLEPLPEQPPYADRYPEQFAVDTAAENPSDNDESGDDDDRQAADDEDRADVVGRAEAEPLPAIAPLVDALATDQRLSDWAERVHTILCEEEPWSAVDVDRAVDVVDRVREATQEVDELVRTVGPSKQAVLLRRVQYALQRRLAVWEQIRRIHDARQIEVGTARLESRRLAQRIAAVRGLLQNSAEQDGWNRYLMLATLDDAVRTSDDNPAHVRSAARRVLRRLEYTPLSASQEYFLNAPPVVELTEELRLWAAEPVSMDELLEHVHAYERSPLPSAARRVAQQQQRLAWAAEPELRELARQVDQHYRNCNVRISLHRDLLQRLLPEPREQQTPVRETVLGVPVRGRSHTTTDLALRLLPDEHRLRWSLEVQGRVTSWTSSQAGPARFRHRGNAWFLAEQPMELDLSGIRAYDVTAYVDGRNRLTSLGTDYDPIPLLGWVVRGEAQRRHDEQSGRARRLMERKIAREAESQITLDTNERLAVINAQLEQRLLVPLARLSLEPTAVDYQTTEERLTARVRLADDAQLAAHTPRPRAPSDSLMSVQVHESALNNVLERLDLAGHTFSAQELHEWIRYKLNITSEDGEETHPDDVWIALAASDPLRVECRDGRLHVFLVVDWLQKGKRRWHNFEVRVTYRPDLESRRGELERDGTIQLIGDQLGGRGQIALRSAFSRMFSPQRRWQLLPEEWGQDERLGDLEISQFVIQDGWIALAVRPEANPRRSLVARPLADGDRDQEAATR